MTTRLTCVAVENSTFIVRVSFTDEDGVAEIPTAITWTLTDEADTVVNARTAVVIAIPAATNDIVLSGPDLALAGYVGVERLLTIEATYTSALGAGLPIKAEAWFTIEPLVSVP